MGVAASWGLPTTTDQHAVNRSCVCREGWRMEVEESSVIQKLYPERKSWRITRHALVVKIGGSKRKNRGKSAR